MKKTFLEIIEIQFNFLVEDFDYKIVKRKKDNFFPFITYLSNKCGVEIGYDVRDGWLSVKMYKLLNGKIIRNPIIISSDTPLSGFTLDDLVSLRDNSKSILPIYNQPENSLYRKEDNGLELYFRDMAKNLKTIGSDVIVGEFKVFELLEKIVKNRISLYSKY